MLSSHKSGDRPTVFIEIIQRVGCMPGDEVSSTAVAKSVREGGESFFFSYRSRRMHLHDLQVFVHEANSHRDHKEMHPTSSSLLHPLPQAAQMKSLKRLAAVVSGKATSTSCSSA